MLLIFEMWLDFIILTTFLLYLFNQSMSTSPLFLAKEKNCKLKFTEALENIHDTKIMAGPFFKTSGFGCTVNFDFASLQLLCLVDDF